MDDMQLNQPILIALIVYGSFMFGVALFWMRKAKKPLDFLMGGRGLPFWVQIGTLTATGIGTGVTVGASGWAYESGWASCAYPIGLGAGIVIAGLLFARMRRYKFMTLSEEIVSYYGGNRVIFEFSNVALFLSQVFWMTVQIMGGGAVLYVVLGLDQKYCVIIAGALIAATALPGGLLTVVYTDVIQACVLMVGFITLTVLALGDTGGLAGLHERVPESYVTVFGKEGLKGLAVFSTFLTLTLSIIADPCRRLIMYSGKSERGGKIAMVSAGLIEIAFASLVAIVGMYAFSLNPNISPSDSALPWLIVNKLPVWLAAFIVISITAAVFSSGNSNGAAASTYFMRHIYPFFTGRYPKRPMLAIRLAMIVMFTASTTMALYAESIVGFVKQFLAVFISGLAVVIILGRYWKRSTWQGAVAALIAAAAVSLLIIFVPKISDMFLGEPMIPATVAAIVAQIVVSLCTPRTTKTFDEVVESMRLQREGLDESDLNPQAAAQLAGGCARVGQTTEV